MKTVALSELHKLYLSLTVRKFAVSLFGIFVPIYLYNLGYSIHDITVFYLLYSVVKVLICPFVMVVIAQKQTRYAMLIAYGLTALFIAGLLSVEVWLGAIYMTAITMALMHGFLWSTLHAKVTRLYDMHKGSQQVAQMQIADRLASLAGPLIGGILATRLSIRFVFMVAMVLLVFATIVLWRVQLNDPVNLRLSRKIITPLKDMIANFNFNIASTVDSTVWPLYVALFLSSYEAVGLVTALGFSGAILATYYAGLYGDKGQNKSTLLAGTGMSALLNILRPLMVTPLTISGISLAKDTAGGAVGTAYSSIYYRHTRESEGQVNYIYGMEIAGGLAAVCLWLVLLYATTILPIKGVLVVSFVVAAIANLFINYIRSDIVSIQN